MPAASNAATDVALAVVASGLGGQRSGADRAGRTWRLALRLVGAAAAAGAVAHGIDAYAPPLASGLRPAAWRAATHLSAAAGSLILAGSVLRTAKPPVAGPLLVATTLDAITWQRRLAGDFAYASAARAHARALLVSAVLITPRAWERSPGARPALSAVVLAGAAGLVQARRWGRGRSLDHNDLYHILLAVAAVLLDRAAAAGVDRADAGAQPDAARA